MTAVPTSTRIDDVFARHFAQAECIVEFAIGEQAGIRRYSGTTKLHHDAAIESGPKNAFQCFTRRVRHFGPHRAFESCCNYTANHSKPLIPLARSSGESGFQPTVFRAKRWHEKLAQEQRREWWTSIQVYADTRDFATFSKDQRELDDALEATRIRDERAGEPAISVPKKWSKTMSDVIDAYAKAKDDGYTGSFAAFLKQHNASS